VLRFVRRSVAVAAVLLTSVALAGPAIAADPPASSSPSASASTGYACLDQEAGYAPSGVCQLVVVKADAVCRNNAPYLDYEVKPEGTPNTAVSIVWGDPSTANSLTQSNLPLSGSVLWPGTVLDSQGNVVDWPGWSQVNGTWVRGDQWDWVRPSVPVTFKVNPEATVTVTYPPDSVFCNPPQSQVLAADDPTPTSVVLAATGASDTAPLLFVAIGVLLLGSLLIGVRVLVRRRGATR
jgi:hypothetical protein